jgi:hypothetical protein
VAAEYKIEQSDRLAFVERHGTLCRYLAWPDPAVVPEKPTEGRLMTHRWEFISRTRLRALNWFVLVPLCVLGCSTGTDNTGAGNTAAGSNAELGEEGNGVFGPPIKVSLLDPFQGDWKFDKSRTYALWTAQGKAKRVTANEDYVKKNREWWAKSGRASEVAGVSDALHADVKVVGNIFFGQGGPGEEYDLFALHSHGSVVCGKAWHHESRSDPGDMSKLWVRLERVGDEMRFHVKHSERKNWLDPEAFNRPILVDASKCDTLNEKVESNDWTSYVFVHPPTQSPHNAPVSGAQKADKRK